MCCRPVVLSLHLSFVILCANAPLAHAQHLSIDAAAGGGFVGVDTAGVQTIPNTSCDTSNPPKCTADANTVIAIKNTAYSWQPALAVGLVFRYIPNPGATSHDGVGIGVGGQFVFVPHGSSSRAAPAITVHIGTASKQLFLGAVFMPSDTVDIPGGGDRAVLSTGFQTSSLIRPDGGRGPTFFAGVVIDGKSLTSAPEAPAVPAAGGGH
jgi:hypothetical protein